MLWVLTGCSQDQKLADLKSRIDSLDARISVSYKPGFGEFMSSVQVHHAKLWFAGKEQNWRLAEFELHEISEIMEDLQKQQSGRRETQSLAMIKPSLDTMRQVVEQKNPARFKEAFTKLTQMCNECHKAVDFSFNVVKIPETPPFSNQSFGVVGGQ